MYGLVFFLLTVLAACKQQHDKKIALLWQDDRAIGIQIPEDLIRDASENRVEHSVKVVIAGKTHVPAILGEFSPDGDMVLFKPMIPLSPGLSYTILQDGRFVGNVTVPINTSQWPALVAIYPEKDTVPENLLKIYLRFSKPMRTGQSLEHVYLLDEHKDTMRNVFLALQPELWDTTGTVLTLWLDPGRIKRGLVLNQKLGNPLKKSEHYTLIVSDRWKDTRGLQLVKTYTKQFYAGSRDEQILDINKWILTVPKAGTPEPLIIKTNAALDHYLLQESIEILDGVGAPVKGNISVSEKDQLWNFTPAEVWKAQNYKLHVNARLEDLAGNNLNRVFDRDITKDKQTNKAYFDRMFVVKDQNISP